MRVSLILRRVLALQLHLKSPCRQGVCEDVQIAYIGDDIIDLSILVRCGLSVTPSDARIYMKDNVDIVTATKGGEGVFRDIADYILESQNLLEELIKQSRKEN